MTLLSNEFYYAGTTYCWNDLYNYQTITSHIPQVISEPAAFSKYDSFAFAKIKLNSRAIIERTTPKIFHISTDKSFGNLGKEIVEVALQYMIDNDSKLLFFDAMSGVLIYDLSNNRMLCEFVPYPPKDFFVDGVNFVILCQNSKTNNRKIVTTTYWSTTSVTLYPMLRQFSTELVDPEKVKCKAEPAGKFLAMALTAVSLKTVPPTSYDISRISSVIFPEVNPNQYFGILELNESSDQEEQSARKIADTTERKYVDIHVIRRREPIIETFDGPVLLDGWRKLRAFKKIKVSKLIYNPNMEEVVVYPAEQLDATQIQNLRRRLDEFLNGGLPTEDWVHVFVSRLVRKEEES